MESDLIETMEIDNLREALEAMKPDRDEINWSKRLMVMQLAEDLAWSGNTGAELDAAILSIIGHFFTPPGGCDFNDAAARAIWIEAFFKTWCKRLGERSPTPKEFARMFGEIIRAMGDDPTYGLPKRTRRTKPTKQPATILQLVTQAQEDDCERNAEDKNNADENDEPKS